MHKGEGVEGLLSLIYQNSKTDFNTDSFVSRDTIKYNAQNIVFCGSDQARQTKSCAVVGYQRRQDGVIPCLPSG